MSTRTATGSDFAKKVTSHVTDLKVDTWRLWQKTKTREGEFILGAITLFLWLIFVVFLLMLDNQLSNSYFFFLCTTGTQVKTILRMQ